MRTFVRHGRKVREERKFKVYKPWVVDPYWFMLGTSIEKMVMSELVRRGVWFEFRPQDNKLGGFVDPTWEADFAVPQYKIWIEIQGAYFHTLPGQVKADAIRYAAIEDAGWRPLFWWEWDIRERLNELMDAVPEFYFVDPSEQVGRTNKGLPFWSGAEIDQLKGLRSALAARAKPDQLVRRRRDGRRKPK